MNITRRVESYLGSAGQRIETLIAYNADTVEPVTQEQLTEAGVAEPSTVYVGVARIMSSIPTPSGPVPAIPHEIRFPIPVDTLVAAFGAYKTELDSFIEGLKEEQNRAAQESQKQATEELYIPTASESKAINSMKTVDED